MSSSPAVHLNGRRRCRSGAGCGTTAGSCVRSKRNSIHVASSTPDALSMASDRVLERTDMASTTEAPRTTLPVVPPTAKAGAGIDYELFLDCVHCGLCTSSCPTYVELGTEMDSPRGRIYLVRAVTDGRLDPADRDVRRHLDLCLDCRACESACPSGVQYGKLIEPFRIHLAKTLPPAEPLGPLQRLLLFHVTPYARRTRLALAPLRLLQWTGLDRLLERSGLLKLLPRTLRQMQDMVPRLQPARGSLPEVLPAEGPRRRRRGRRSRPRCATSANSSCNSGRCGRSTRCRCGRRTTMPATCVTASRSAASRGSCWR